MRRSSLRDILRFLGGAASAGMLLVLGLRLTGYISHRDALVDLVVLLIVGLLSPAAAFWMNRR